MIAPSGPRMPRFTCVSGPYVPTISSETVSPRSAPEMSPMNGSPICASLGCASRTPWTSITVMKVIALAVRIRLTGARNASTGSSPSSAAISSGSLATSSTARFAATTTCRCAAWDAESHTAVIPAAASTTVTTSCTAST